MKLSDLVGRRATGTGPVASTPTITPVDLPAQTAAPSTSNSIANAPSAGTLYESIDLTAAGAVDTSQPGETLVGLALATGKTPGWLQVLYDGVNSAIFPAPASGLDPTGAIGPQNYTLYPMSIFSPGSTFLASATLTFGGGLSRARFIFSNKANPSSRAVKNWSAMRGVAVTAELSSTTGSPQTYTMPGGQLLTPLGITALMSIAAGTATGFPEAEISVPAIPPLANPYLVPAVMGIRGSEAPPRRYPMPAIGPATSFSLTHEALSLGGATDLQVMAVLWV